jgi:hypothetical protein
MGREREQWEYLSVNSASNISFTPKISVTVRNSGVSDAFNLFKWPSSDEQATNEAKTKGKAEKLTFLRIAERHEQDSRIPEIFHYPKIVNVGKLSRIEFVN